MSGAILENLAVLLVVVPLLAAFLLPTMGGGGALVSRLLGPTALLLEVLLALLLWWRVWDLGPQVIALGGFVPPLGITFYADELAALFALAVPLSALLLWPRETGPEAVRVRALYLLLVAAGCGLSLSGDLFNLYVFYELIAVASYGLAASRGSGAGYAAALRYLVLSAAGSALALLGIALIYGATGTLNLADLSGLASTKLSGPLGMAAFTLLVIGLGVKAELFPVNTWVPEVYASAPVRVSALLAGLVSKLALLVILRLLTLLFAGTSAHWLLLVLGVLGVLSGELAAWRAPDLRRLLGYSSIGQLGLVAIAFSVPGPAGVVAGIALALHHLVVKPALFLLGEQWTGPWSNLAGIARGSRWVGPIFVLLALSLIGVPPLPGFWAKYLLLQGALATAEPAYQLAAAVVVVATVIEVGYLLRVSALLYGEGGEGTPRPAASRSLLTAGGLALLLLVGTVLITPLGNTLRTVGARAADAERYVHAVFPPPAPALLTEAAR